MQLGRAGRVSGASTSCLKSFLTSSRNVLHAELRGDFGVRAVEEVLRKHWTDADLRKRDAEKGRYMSNLAMGKGDEPQGYAAESRQNYPPRPGGKGGDGSPRKQMGSSKPAIQCFRCGGPHRIADCKEKPTGVEQAKVATATEAAPFVFWSSRDTEKQGCELAWGASEMYQSCVTTAQVVAQGKAVLDGGSIEALEYLANIKVEKRGHTGIEKVDLSERPVSGFDNSSKNQCINRQRLSSHGWQTWHGEGPRAGPRVSSDPSVSALSQTARGLNGFRE